MDRIVSICYRKIIDVNSLKQWDRLLFEDSYLEFKIQAQNFSQQTTFTSYGELVKHVPDAQQLPARVVPAVEGYIRQLNGIMPDLLNNLGKRFLRFNEYKFEIINSDIYNKNKHQVAICFYSKPMVWHDTIQNLLLLSEVNENQAEGAILTHLFQLLPYVNIHSIKYDR